MDTAIFLNFLEHIEDDLGALGNIYKVLIPGGKLLLLTPAFRFLYGTMDKADNHYRRYTKSSLRRKLKVVGFMVTEQCYMNFLGIFAWFINGKVLRRTLATERQYLFYDKLAPFLKLIEAKIKPPLGLSIVTVAKK